MYVEESERNPRLRQSRIPRIELSLDEARGLTTLELSRAMRGVRRLLGGRGRVVKLEMEDWAGSGHGWEHEDGGFLCQDPCRAASSLCGTWQSVRRA